MKCTYCGKKIWFWQKSQSRGVYGHSRHYHFDCLFHKLWCRLDDAASYWRQNGTSNDSIETLFKFIESI